MMETNAQMNAGVPFAAMELEKDRKSATMGTLTTLTAALSSALLRSAGTTECRAELGRNATTETHNPMMAVLLSARLKNSTAEMAL